MATNVSDPAARQYAQALLEIGAERKLIGQIYEELNALNQAYRNDATFRRFFTSPKVPANTKMKIIKESLGEGLCEEVLSFLGLLIHKRREPLLDNIMDSFAKYRDDAENRVHVFVESAQPLKDADKKEITKGIEQATGKSVSFHEEVREELIGGLRIRVGDRLLDGSLLKRLRTLSASIVGEEAPLTGVASQGEIDELYERVQAAQ